MTARAPKSVQNQAPGVTAQAHKCDKAHETDTRDTQWTPVDKMCLKHVAILLFFFKN